MTDQRQLLRIDPIREELPDAVETYRYLTWSHYWLGKRVMPPVEAWRGFERFRRNIKEEGE